MAKKKGEAPVMVPEVVQPVSPEVALARTEGGALAALLGSIEAFMVRALDLEDQSKQTLQEARALQLPTNSDEDLAIQRFVERAKSHGKVLEEHWTLTAKISAFHRKLTGQRSRATEPLEQAIKLGNDLHNAYVRAEQRRAEEVARQAREKAEREAREQREREQADLERKAEEAEAQSPELSEREQSFVYHYVGGIGCAGNAVLAAQRAGFKNPDVKAQQLLATPKIIEAVEKKREAARLREQAAAVKQAPVAVETPAAPVADIQGRIGRTYWSAEVYDVDAFMAALLDPKERTRHGIPSDIATFVQAKLNDCARTLHENIDRWPGVRHKKETKL